MLAVGGDSNSNTLMQPISHAFLCGSGRPGLSFYVYKDWTPHLIHGFSLYTENVLIVDVSTHAH